MSYKVYLAGPMEYTDDPFTFRNEIRYLFRSYEFDGYFLDPTRDKDIRSWSPDEVVTRDVCDIRSSDVILSYAPKGVRVVGTLMEMAYARLYFVPVIFVTDDPTLASHPWILLHSHKIVSTLSEAVDYIVSNSCLWNRTSL